jgi:hypothetical protein
VGDTGSVWLEHGSWPGMYGEGGGKEPSSAKSARDTLGGEGNPAKALRAVGFACAAWRARAARGQESEAVIGRDCRMLPSYSYCA